MDPLKHRAVRVGVVARFIAWLRCCVIPRPCHDVYSACTLRRLGSFYTLRGAKRYAARHGWPIEEVSPGGLVFVDDAPQ